MRSRERVLAHTFCTLLSGIRSHWFRARHLYPIVDPGHHRQEKHSTCPMHLPIRNLGRLRCLDETLFSASEQMMCTWKDLDCVVTRVRTQLLYNVSTLAKQPSRRHTYTLWRTPANIGLSHKYRLTPADTHFGAHFLKRSTPSHPTLNGPISKPLPKALAASDSPACKTTLSKGHADGTIMATSPVCKSH